MKSIPDIPVTVIDEPQATIRVLPKGAREPRPTPFLDASVRERWNDCGIGLLLQEDGRYRDAITELEQVLAIDPEDLQGHYNLMLSYQGAGDSEMAKRHEALYRRFKADESARTITGPYQKLHPHDNSERQAVHEHVCGLGPTDRRVAGGNGGRP